MSYLSEQDISICNCYIENAIIVKSEINLAAEVIENGWEFNLV